MFLCYYKTVFKKLRLVQGAQEYLHPMTHVAVIIYYHHHHHHSSLL